MKSLCESSVLLLCGQLGHTTTAHSSHTVTS